MIIFKIIIVVGIFIGGMTCIVYHKKLALGLQRIYIKEAEKKALSKNVWKKLWVLNLFRVIIVFLGLLLMISAYPIVFGPYQ